MPHATRIVTCVCHMRTGGFIADATYDILEALQQPRAVTYECCEFGYVERAVAIDIF